MALLVMWILQHVHVFVLLMLEICPLGSSSINPDDLSKNLFRGDITKLEIDAIANAGND